jgi:endonuclease-3
VRRAERVTAVLAFLADHYGDATCELVFKNPWELLVATVLSAQCTDVRVNQVTPGLFARWPDPASLAAAPIAEVEEVVRPTGFFRNKARALRDGARALVADHGGEVPLDIDALTALPGVGRKTAKVVLGEAFRIPAGIVVDTHVRRLANRWDLSRHSDPEKVASQLETLIPRDDWIDFGQRTIHHGRRLCAARRPKCEDCALEPICPKRGV